MAPIFGTIQPNKIKFIVGIDEVGRGPLAGPVAIGAVLFRADRIPEHLLGARDSKQLSPDARELWFGKIREARRNGDLDYRVAFVGAPLIDRDGIVPSLNLAMRRTLERLSPHPRQTLILLDGGLKAPEHFLFQQTIIGGDRTEPIISLASIAAKVLRDRKMTRLAREFPEFGFEIHKGYGTKLHRERIREYGPCELHRRSFISRVLLTK